MDLINIMNTASTAIDLTKKLRGALEKIKNAEILIWVADLQNHILDLKGIILELRDENQKQMEKITKLENKLKREDQYFFEDNVYWDKKPDGKKGDAICPACLGKNDQAIRMSLTGKNHYFCQACKSGYNTITDDRRYY